MAARFSLNMGLFFFFVLFFLFGFFFLFFVFLSGVSLSLQQVYQPTKQNKLKYPSKLTANYVKKLS